MRLSCAEKFTRGLIADRQRKTAFDIGAQNVRAFESNVVGRELLLLRAQFRETPKRFKMRRRAGRHRWSDDDRRGP